jgi:hypothetical protein
VRLAIAALLDAVEAEWLAGSTSMSPSPTQRWPLDTKLFAIGLAAWALHVVGRAYFEESQLTVGRALMLFNGLKLYADEARIALLVEAGIFFAVALGMYLQRRWALLMAFALMADVVLNHLLFVITNLSTPAELTRVRTEAFEGPVLVALALYLWIRSKRLVFGWNSAS